MRLIRNRQKFAVASVSLNFDQIRCIKCEANYVPTINGCVPCNIDNCKECIERGPIKDFTEYYTIFKPKDDDSELK